MCAFLSFNSIEHYSFKRSSRYRKITQFMNKVCNEGDFNEKLSVCSMLYSGCIGMQLCI